MFKLLFRIDDLSSSSSKPKTDVFKKMNPFDYSYHIVTLLEENDNISKNDNKLFKKFDWSSLNRNNIEGQEDLLWYKKDNHLLFGIKKGSASSASSSAAVSNYIKELVEKSYIRIKDGDYNGYSRIEKMYVSKSKIYTYPIETSIFDDEINDIVRVVSEGFGNLISKLDFFYVKIGVGTWTPQFGTYIKNYMQKLKTDTVNAIKKESDKLYLSKPKTDQVEDELISTYIVSKFEEQVRDLKSEQDKFRKEAEKYLDYLSSKTHLSNFKNIKFNPRDNKEKNKYRVSSEINFVKIKNKANDFKDIDDNDWIKENVKKWEMNKLFLTNEEISKKNEKNIEENNCRKKIKDVVRVSKRLLDVNPNNNIVHKDTFDITKGMEAHVHNFISHELKEWWIYNFTSHELKEWWNKVKNMVSKIAFTE